MNRAPPAGPKAGPQKRQLVAHIQKLNQSLVAGDGQARLESADGQAGFPTITRSLKMNQPINRQNPPAEAMQRLGEGDLQGLAERLHNAQPPTAFASENTEQPVVQPNFSAAIPNAAIQQSFVRGTPEFSRSSAPSPTPPRPPLRQASAQNQQVRRPEIRRGTKEQPNPPAITAEHQAALGVQIVSNKPNGAVEQPQQIQPQQQRPAIPKPLMEPPGVRRKPMMPTSRKQQIQESHTYATQERNTPIPPPQPQNIQQQLNARAQYLKDLSKQQQPPVFQRADEELTVSEQQPFRVQDPLSNEAEFTERIIFPSHGVFYDIQDISIRPIDVPDLAMLAKAMKQNDLIAINDVLNGCIDVDIRDLWVGDWRYILYWLRINSLTKIPYTVNWVSFYGNRNRSQVTNSTIEFTMLSDFIDRETWQEWENKGFTYPTVRDMEEYTTTESQMSEEYKWYYDRAQFLQGNSIEEKVSFLQSPEMRSLDTLAEIRELSETLGKAGVKESIQARDANFDLHKAFAGLKQEGEQLNLALESNFDLTVEQEEAIVERLQMINAEIDRFNRGEAEPMLETIPMRISIFAFFPGI